MVKATVLLLLLLAQSLIAGTPTEALKSFQQATKDQKFDAAWQNTAQFEGASDDVTQYLKSRVERIMKLAADGWGFDILEEKIIGECAVIVTNESTKAGRKASDIDPVYMIKQGDHWRVLPEITNWDMTKWIPADKQPASMKFDEKKASAYRELEKWFAERKAVLKKE